MSLRILVVDDSRIIRKIIRKTLQLAKIPVDVTFEASNGKEALEILEQNDVHIVFADINMPVMNGLEMINSLWEKGIMENLKVIVISTDGSQNRIEELKAKGVCSYLRKPFTPEVLRKIVLETIGENNGII
ncbi:response regulator [bacterium]|nr:response regulator [bacterium]